MPDLQMLHMYGKGFRPITLEDLHKETGPGWSGILTRLVEDLSKLGWDGKILQVKEKFGGLRFYIDKASDEIHARISQAEAEADKTCEFCGAPGEMRDGGWWKTLCDACHDKREKERSARK